MVAPRGRPSGGSRLLPGFWRGGSPGNIVSALRRRIWPNLSVSMWRCRGFCGLRRQAAPNPFAAASTPALSGAALRPDQGRRLPARLRRRHEAADGGDRRPSPAIRPRPVSTTPSSRWNVRAACWSGSTTPSSRVVQANTNPALDKVQTVEAPKLAAHNDAIFLNAKLFARVKALYDQRAALKLDPEALQVLTLYYRQFVHAGANLSDSGQDAAAADQQGRCQPGSRSSSRSWWRPPRRARWWWTTRPIWPA